MRLHHVVLPFLALPLFTSACAAPPAEPDSESESSSDELRALTADEIVGTIAYGETRSAIAYDESSTYRALAFEAAAGDEIAIDVRAAGADARAWLLGTDFRTLASSDDAAPGVRDARITRRLAGGGRYYVAFREKNYEDATFSVSLTRTNAPPAPTTDDPFDPASCQGPAHSNPASLFTPGGTKHELGRSIVRWESRECNSVTGCTPWKNEGSSFAGVQWAGTAELLVVGDGIDARLYGTVRQNERTTSARCRLGAEGALSCQRENYLGRDYISLSGTMRGSCLRSTGEAQYKNPLTGNPSGSEYRVAMLVRF